MISDKAFNNTVKNRDIFKSTRVTYFKRVQEIEHKLTDLSNHIVNTPVETLAILHNIKANSDLSIYSAKLDNFKITTIFDHSAGFTFNLFGVTKTARFKGDIQEISIKIEVYLKWMDKEKEEINSLIKEYNDYRDGLID